MHLNLKMIGERIKHQRTVVDMTQGMLAKQANLSRATINALENNSIKEIGVSRVAGIYSILAHEMRAKSLAESISPDLSFPYHWSNSNISEDALIINVLERGIFEDIAIICARYGFKKVKSISTNLQSNSIYLERTLNRMLTNISKAFHYD